MPYEDDGSYTPDPRLAQMQAPLPLLAYPPVPNPVNYPYRQLTLNVHQDADVTLAQVSYAGTDDNSIQVSGSARREPGDASVPSIGEALATARALEKLAAKLRKKAQGEMNTAAYHRKQREKKRARTAMQPPMDATEHRKFMASLAEEHMASGKPMTTIDDLADKIAREKSPGYMGATGGGGGGGGNYTVTFNGGFGGGGSGGSAKPRFITGQVYLWGPVVTPQALWLRGTRGWLRVNTDVYYTDAQTVESWLADLHPVTVAS